MAESIDCKVEAIWMKKSKNRLVGLFFLGLVMGWSVWEGEKERTGLGRVEKIFLFILAFGVLGFCVFWFWIGDLWWNLNGPLSWFWDDHSFWEWSDSLRISSPTPFSICSSSQLYIYILFFSQNWHSKYIVYLGFI